MATPETNPKRPRTRRHDLLWRTGDLVGLLLLCILLGGSLCAAAISGRCWFQRGVPADDARIAAVTDRIDPNTATYASLRRLPGIGEAKAKAVVDYRQVHGPNAFRTADDLDKVPHRWGPSDVERVGPFLSLPAGK